MTGTTRGWRGRCGEHRDHGDNMGRRPRKQRRPQVMGTTWGPSGGYGDNVGTTGTTWGPWGQHGVETTETTETTGHGDHMGTFWGLWGRCGDDVGMTGMTWGWWGQHGDHRDNEITKNDITFERIEIIEFRLKIWDSWTLPHTCRLQLMCRWGGVLSQMAFLSKKCSGDPQKIFFPVFALDPIRPYLDWALRGFLTSWPICDPLKSQPKWKQSAKFD